MFSTVNRLPAGSPTFKMTANVLPPITPVSLTSLICVCDEPVFSLPPGIAGDNPAGQAPDPITCAGPCPELIQPTQPDWVGLFWMVRTMLEPPIPAPLPDATPSNTSDAFAELANITVHTSTSAAGPVLRSIPVII